MDIRQYAIGIILDDSLKATDVTKTGVLFTFLKNNLNENDKNTNDYTLKNSIEAVKINIYIAVARNVPTRIRERLHELTTGSTAPTNIKFMWFGDNFDRTKDEIEKRLLQWIGEDGADKVLIVDPNSDTSGALKDKFI